MRKNAPHGHQIGGRLREACLLYIKGNKISKAELARRISSKAQISQWTVISFLGGKYAPRDPALVELVKGFRAIGGKFDGDLAYAALLAEAPIEILWDEIRSRSDEEIQWLRNRLKSLRLRASKNFL
jgi:hypothetical protein